MDRPTLAGILRTHGSPYRRRHALSPTQARAWRAIVDCRTAALGGAITREPGPVKGGTTVIAFITDPDGYKIELIQRAS